MRGLPSPGPRLRATVLATGLLVALVLLFGRLFFLQVVRHEEFSGKSEQQNRSLHTVAPPRGTILSAEGRVLAVEVPAYDLAIDPRTAGDDLDARLEQVAVALDRPVNELRAELEPFLDRAYRVLARDLTDAQVRGLRDLEDSRGRLPRGLILEQRAGRVYPQERLAAAVLGFNNREGKGASGLELTFDSLLRGEAGRKRLRRDARQVAMSSAATPWVEAPVDGADIVLTLRLPVQFAAEMALSEIQEKWKPRASVAVVIEVATGDVLALASRPTFDPNRYNESEPEAWKVRAVTDVFEPGSTFKSFTLAAALDQGALTLDSLINCEGGKWQVFGRRLEDTHNHDQLSVMDVLVESSNIGAAKIALSLANGSDTRPAMILLHQYLTETFAFGHAIGIGLPGELSGLVRPPEKWTNQTLTSVPMGYAVMVTPLQLAAAYATLASGGIYRRPRLVKEVRCAEGIELPPEVVELITPAPPIQVLDMSDPRRDVRRALTAVVERGTARRVEKLSGGQMGGKTGTSHKVDPERGVYVDRYVASFVGIAPMVSPRYVCLIVVDEPEGAHYGGTVAAPGVRGVLEATMQALTAPPAGSW